MSRREKPPPRERLAQLRRMLALIFRYGWRLRWAIVLVFVMGVLEAFATKAPLLLVGRVIQRVVLDEVEPAPGGKQDVLAAVEGRVLDLLGIRLDRPEGTPDGRIQARRHTLLAVGVLAVLLAVVGAVATYSYFRLSQYLALKVVVDLRADLCRHLLTLGLGFFSRRKLGDLISRVANDTAVTLRTFSLVFENMLIEPLHLLGNFALAAYALNSIFLALLMVLAIPLMAVPIYQFGRRVRKGSFKSLEAMAESIESMSQMFSGIRTVQAFQAESREIRAFEEINHRFLRRFMSMIKAKAASHGVISLLYQSAFAVLILVLGWFSVDPNHRFMAAEDMVVLTLALTTSYTHVKRLTRSYTTIMESLAATERISELLHAEADFRDVPGAVELAAVRGEVEVREAGFAYDVEPVLQGITFRCRAGQTVAFVGPSGAGKTTLMDLIARFYDVSSGAILVDGHDLRRIRIASYRRHVALVSQNPFLFNTTIGENIRYGKTDATEEEVHAAARAANIHDFILTLPEGYGTVVGERGVRLSGGQLQRITIARAILKNAGILLLDEATSSLDSEAERSVQEALDRLRRGKTCFVIAHRLSTVRAADLILVLDHGRIVEQGTHEELLGRGGLYKRLHDLQFRDDGAAAGPAPGE